MTPSYCDCYCKLAFRWDIITPVSQNITPKINSMGKVMWVNCHMGKEGTCLCMPSVICSRELYDRTHEYWYVPLTRVHYVELFLLSTIWHGYHNVFQESVEGASNCIRVFFYVADSGLHLAEIGSCMTETFQDKNHDSVISCTYLITKLLH